MINNKLKILSASAVTLIALTGTAYGTERVDVPDAGSDVAEVQQKETRDSSTAQSSKETPEDATKDSTVNATKDSSSKDSSKETTTEEAETENKEDEANKGSEESGKTESAESEKEPVEEDKEGEVEEEVEEVDEKAVVPSKDLPYDKDTGLLDFAKYHKLANGRALPRELTKEERDYFHDYVEEGKYKEIRTSVTEQEYSLIKIYPADYYITEDGIELKRDKYTAIYSELLPLDQQKVYLEERKAEEQELINQGFVYDKDSGEFVLGLTDSDDVLHGVDVDGVGDIDGAITTDPVENDDAKQEIHYEEKELYGDISAYDKLTDKKFLSEYGANFLLRGEVPAGGFIQREYKLAEGLTLAVELESVQDEGEDNIFLTWGVVREPIKYENNTGGMKIAGKYNFSTNESSDTYIKDNVLEVGTAQLREDGKYTPSKVYVEYTDSQDVPHAYLLVADAVLVGEDQKRLSELVGYIEFGWENIYEDGFETGEEDPDKGESDNGNNGGSGNTNEGTKPDSGDNNGSNNNNNTGTGNTGTGDESAHDKLPDWVKPIDTNKDGIIAKEEAEKAGYDVDALLQKDHPLYDYMEKDEDKGTSSTVNGKEDESSESFKQTGTAIVWGSIFTGLGLGAIGAYLKKRGKKDAGEDKQDTEDSN